MTVEALMFAGALAGLLFGLTAWSRKIGCVLMALISVAMIVYVAVWQEMHPENLRSTSGLDFMFLPLAPSLGAFGGWSVGAFVRSLLKDR
jgi:hypothetical protein